MTTEIENLQELIKEAKEVLEYIKNSTETYNTAVSPLVENVIPIADYMVALKVLRSLILLCAAFENSGNDWYEEHLMLFRAAFAAIKREIKAGCHFTIENANAKIKEIKESTFPFLVE